MQIFTSIDEIGGDFVRSLYNGFEAPIATLDCGKKCAVHNPSGKPFCCDICHAVPAAYKSEWRYLQSNWVLSIDLLTLFQPFAILVITFKHNRD